MPALIHAAQFPPDSLLGKLFDELQVGWRDHFDNLAEKLTPEAEAAPFACAARGHDAGASPLMARRKAQALGSAIPACAVGDWFCEISGAGMVEPSGIEPLTSCMPFNPSANSWMPV